MCKTLTWARSFPLGFSTAPHVSLFFHLEIKSPRCCLFTCIWMGKLKTKWDDMGIVTCGRSVRHALSPTCRGCGREGLGWAGLGGSLSTVQLVSTSIYYPIFPFHAYDLNDYTSFFKLYFFLILSYIFNTTWNLFLNSKGRSLRTEIICFVNCLIRRLQVMLSILVSWILPFMAARTCLLGFYVKLWRR